MTDERASRSRRRSLIACRVAAYIMAALVCGAIPYHIWRGSPAFLGLLEDDYFYYATIADHVVTSGHLSYDGITLTNGFHPLWMLVILGLRAVFGRFGPRYYLALGATSFVSACASYELTRCLAKRLGAGEIRASVIGALLAVGTSRLVSNGMECTLGVPLLLWLLAEAARPVTMSPKRAAWLGFVASLAILARLDIVLAVALLVGGFLAVSAESIREKLRLVCWFTAGTLLVAVYLAANVTFFGSLVPVSGLAKHAYRIGFNPRYLRAVALTSPYGLMLAVIVPAGIGAFLLLQRRPTTISPGAQFIGAVALAFAALFWTMSAVSGWIFFGWYAYPAAPAAAASLVFVSELRPIRSRAIALAVVAAILAIQLSAAAVYFRQHGPGWQVSDNSMLAMSYQLREQLQQRPGRVAMGAIAGIAAYVSDRPFVQLEGIVGDRKMLEHIRRQDPVGAVLDELGVDYLVITLANVRAQSHDGCYAITQPNAEWAGKRASKMRAEICAPPIVHFLTPAGTKPWSVFPELETLVWEVRGARWRNEMAISQ
jgi:hypothetical protein